MPTYDYECTHCGYVFEVFQRINDAPLENCPKCKEKLRRLIGGGAGIIFKGPGFYATDYRKKGPTKECPKNKEGCDTCPHAKKLK